MTLPETYTLIRHGLSEANIVQNQRKAKTLTALPDGFFDRHDSSMRLAYEGERQALAAAEWLSNNKPDFDRYYVSPHVRACETAYNLRLEGNWIIDDRFRERDYGEIHSIGRDLQDPLSEASKHSRELSKWYWKPQGGESLATGVRLRVEKIMDSFYRREGIRNVVAVTHGEFIRVSQMVIERMTPEMWTAQNNDDKYKVQNCMIVQYSRIDPEDPEHVSHRFKWKRAICPWDESLSWDNGEWVKFEPVKYSDADLKNYVQNHIRLFEE